MKISTKLLAVSLLSVGIAVKAVNSKYYTREIIAQTNQKLKAAHEAFNAIEEECSQSPNAPECTELQKAVRRLAKLREISKECKAERRAAKPARNIHPHEYRVAKGVRAQVKARYEKYQKTGHLPQQI